MKGGYGAYLIKLLANIVVIYDIILTLKKSAKITP
jgi:hypothetical protein